MTPFPTRDGPMITSERPTGARRATTVTYLFGLFRRHFEEDEMVANVVYGGAGYVDTDTIVYWKRRT